MHISRVLLYIYLTFAVFGQDWLADLGGGGGGVGGGAFVLLEEE